MSLYTRIMVTNNESDNASWSFLRTQWTGSLPGTVATKRYEKRLMSTLWVALLLGGMNGFVSIPPGKQYAYVMAPINVVAAAGFALFYGRSFLLLLKEADELERQIHLEAIAFAFVALVCATMVLGALHWQYGWTMNPIWFYAVELLRGIVVGLKARKYGRD